MSQATITIPTNPHFKRKAQDYFKKNGINLELVVRSYLEQMVGESSEEQIIITSIPDADLTEDDLKELAYAKSLPTEELISFTKEGYAHT